MRHVRIALTFSVATLLVAGSSRAAILSVTNTNDSGAGSLRDVITQANTNLGFDVININTGGVINVLSTLPTITGQVTINGLTANALTIRRNGAAPYPVFKVSTNLPVEINRLTIANGDCSLDSGGGVATTGAVNLSLNDVVFTGNRCAGLGAAALGMSAGTVSLTRIRVTASTGSVAALGLFGNATITESAIEDNALTGIWSDASLTIDGSTISGNAASAAPGVGGLRMENATVTITNTTFSGNTGSTIGVTAGDIWPSADGGTVTLQNVTLAGSTAPSILMDHAATLIMRNTLLAGAGANCLLSAGTTTSNGNNLSTDATCNLVHGADQANTDPLIDALGFNGGLTQTRKLLPTSPALNTGSNTGAPAFDQRGFDRLAGGTSDIGAFEATPPRRPTIDSATPGDTQASLAYTLGSSDAPITEVTVTCMPGPVTKTATASPVIVTGLTNGTAYDCTMVATSVFGTSPASSGIAVTPGAAVDAGADAGEDAGVEPDAGPADSGPADAGTLVDASRDAATPSSDGSAARPDTGTPRDGAIAADGAPVPAPADDSGCGCDVAGLGETSPYTLGLIGLASVVAFWRRRRGRH